MKIFCFLRIEMNVLRNGIYRMLFYDFTKIYEIEDTFWGTRYKWMNLWGGSKDKLNYRNPSGNPTVIATLENANSFFVQTL